ncbi:MAG: lysophospholipid acyltransferase family protein [Armatimonadota bacterium]|nr:lysophospholipid acyltransferase family protein [Armatimonadota bacterium]
MRRPERKEQNGRGVEARPARARRVGVGRWLKRAGVWCAVCVLMAPVRVLPLPALRRFAAGVAWVVRGLTYRRQRMVEQNLIAVFGDRLTPAQRRRIRVESVRNICKTMAELVKMRWLTPDELRRQMSYEGVEHLDAALARGKGAILVTAHFGSWELGGGLLGVLGYPVNVIARDANDGFTRKVINRARESKGVRVLGRSDLPRMLRALKNNEILAILPDQHAVEGAVRVPFLGRPAQTPSGPALLSLRTGAPILPVFSYRQPDDHIYCRVLPPLQYTPTGNRDTDVVELTRLMNEAIGREILAHPEQWLWLHRRWRD